jgi:hypothetical protein
MLARAITALNGAIFGLTGVAFLVDPVGMAAAVSLTAGTPVSVNEIRAFYGGLEVGLGVLLLSAAVRRIWLAPVLALQVAVLGGIVMARLLGFAAEGLPGQPIYTLLAIELAMGLSAGIAYALLRRNATRGFED